MNKTIYDFERKYKVQDNLLNNDALQGLDERTLHETIKAMLINTIKDCIKYQNWIDPDISEISHLIVKEEKTQDEIMKIKKVQDSLRNSLHFTKISENSLYTLLYKILSTDYIKHAFKQDMPALYENIYYLIDIEDEIAENLTFYFAELYEEPNYKEICNAINGTIEDFIENAEEYIDGVKEHDLYDAFASYREQSKKEKENINE